jgi:hypothetical protein
MRIEKNKLHLRQIGKGFIFLIIDGLAGRRLTKTFIDQRKRTYIKINGELTLLTAEHNFLSID